jgi:ABC-type Fe3+/spermidine/putrescine transport system ATPase subunit
MVIGLERCTEGEIVYQGQVVDSARSHVHVPTHKRNMGMVFQSYAIWPHMTVFENVAYPLRVRRAKKSEVQSAVGRVLEQVGLAGLESRPATMLSGGQQQRVALARSLVFEPKILLLDEPFSNLDAKLREQMRAELRVLQRRLGITVLFVTHDQVEALSLSDRIAVMNAGHVEQIGSPNELYLDPQTPAVRDFLGRTIILPGRVIAVEPGEAITAAVGDGSWRPFVCDAEPDANLREGQPCYLAIRPEQVRVEPASGGSSASAVGQAGAASGGLGQNQVEGVIEALLFVGERYEARIALPWDERILAYLPPTTGWREDQRVILTLPRDQIRAWPG